MFTIRAAALDDRGAMDGVIQAAFGAADEAEVATVLATWRAVRSSDHLLGELVAEVDGELVGHVGVSRCWIDARQSLVPASLLSPLGVLPEHAGAGIGSTLVEAAVALSRELGDPAIFLEGDPGFYRRCGFDPAAAHGFEAPSARIPTAAFQVIVGPRLEAWMTGGVIYPEAWWVHDAVGLRDPLLADLEQGSRSLD